MIGSESVICWMLRWKAITFSKNRERGDLDKDRLLVLSLVKSVEIIGEAASKVSQDTRDHYPEIPWANIVGMRNRLIHVYFDIDLDRVWDTATDDLPQLISALEKIVGHEEKS